MPPIGPKTLDIPPEYIDVSTSKASRNHRGHISGYESGTTEPYRRKKHFRRKRRTKAELAKYGTRKSNPHWWSEQARNRRKQEKRKKELLREFGGS